MDDLGAVQRRHDFQVAPKGIDLSIKNIGRQRVEMERRLVAVEQRYRAQFIALEMMRSSMNQTSNYLTQQLAQLSNLR